MAPTKLGALRGGSIGNLHSLVNRKAGSRARAVEQNRTNPRALRPPLRKGPLMDGLKR